MQREGAWKKDASVLLVLLAIPTLLTADVLLLGSTFYFRDLTGFFYGSDHVYREIVRAGEWPLWNPYFAAGQPLAANPEFSAFYPLRWLALLPGFRFGFNLQLVLHLHLALAGMYLLLRSMKLRIVAASFGALAFGIGGFTSSYLNIPPFLFTVAWAPFVMLFARRLIVRPTRMDFALTAICFGIQQLAGEPTGILQTGMLLAALLLYESVQQSETAKWRFFIGRASFLGGAMLAGVLVAAVQVFGTLDFVRDTVRAEGLSFTTVKRWSMPPIRVVELFFPAFMGHKADAGTLYWGVTAYSSGEGPYIVDLYVGYFAALLALCGALTRQKEWALWTSLMVLSFLIAIGDHTPLLRLLYDLGIFRAFRYPEKFVLLGMLPLVIQSSICFERLLAGDRRTIRGATIIAAALLGVAAAFLVFSYSGSYEAWLRSFWAIPREDLLSMVAAATRVDWMVATIRGAVMLLLVGSLLRVQASRTWLAVAALFVLYDLGTTSNRDLPRLQREYFDAPPAVAELRRNPESRLFHEAFVREQEFGAPAPGRGEARYWIVRDGLYPKLPALWGIQTVLEPDYDVTHLRPTRDLYSAMLVATKVRGGTVPPIFLQISNVGSVATHGDGGITFHGAGPYPRFYFARRIVRYRTLQDFIQAAVERDWLPGDAFLDFNPGLPGKAEITRVRESWRAVDLDVRVEGKAFLVIGITPHRYWRATIDGRPAELMRANVGYQGLIVPRGARHVSLRYSNPVIFAGAAVSAVTLFFLIVSAMIGRTVRALDDKQLPAR